MKLILLLWVLGSLAVQAQVAVQKPASPSSWRITYERIAPAPGAPAAPAPLFKQISERTYSIDGAVAILETKYDDNTEKIAYLVDGGELSRSPKTNKIRWLPSHEELAPVANCFEVYPGFEWVEDKYLIGKATVNGKKCLHYRFGSEGVASEAIARQEAWVTEGERLPVAFVKYDAKGIYTFLEKPVTPLKIPQEFLDYRNSLIRKPQ